MKIILVKQAGKHFWGKIDNSLKHEQKPGQRILTRDLQFSSTILSPLSHADYMRSNRLMYKISKHSYGTGKSPSFDVVSLKV